MNIIKIGFNGILMIESCLLRNARRIFSESFIYREYDKRFCRVDYMVFLFAVKRF